MSELNSHTGTASSLLTALFYNLNMLKNLPNSRRYLPRWHKSISALMEAPALVPT